MQAYGKALRIIKRRFEEHLRGRSDSMQELNDRFKQYFFVITGEDFARLTPPVKDFFIIPAPIEAGSG